MKTALILAVFTVSVALQAIGEQDFEFKAGAVKEQNQTKGPVRIGYEKKGVTNMQEKGNAFVRFEQDASDPAHRAKISVSLLRKKQTFNKTSFTISALARMEPKRNGNLYIMQLQNVRLGMNEARPYAWISSQKKSFSMQMDPAKTPVTPGKWVYLHLSVNRQGELALYINGELSASRNIADRQDEEWAPAPYFFITAYNRKADNDNPIAKMDVMRIAVREGLMSSAQIRKEAHEWFAEIKK